MFFIRERCIEWRASRISDPVARLRYLRAEKSAASSDRARFRYLGALVCMLALVFLTPAHIIRSAESSQVSVAPPPGRDSVRRTSLPPVWLVESSPEHELYSNGLRVGRPFMVAHYPRSF